jgi:hypothetical protein
VRFSLARRGDAANGQQEDQSVQYHTCPASLFVDDRYAFSKSDEGTASGFAKIWHGYGRHLHRIISANASFCTWALASIFDFTSRTSLRAIGLMSETKVLSELVTLIVCEGKRSLVQIGRLTTDQLERV